MPDHPAIQNCARTGYPDGITPSRPCCPVCGRECETIYQDELGIIAGCDQCLTAKDSWEVDDCFPNLKGA